MLKLLTTLFFTFSITMSYAQGLGDSIIPVPPPSIPEEDPNDGVLKKYETGMLCGPTSALADNFAARGMILLLTGEKYPNDPGVFSHTALLVNPLSGEYSFVFISDQYRITCIVHQGINLTLLSPQTQ